MKSNGSCSFTEKAHEMINQWYQKMKMSQLNQSMDVSGDAEGTCVTGMNVILTKAEAKTLRPRCFTVLRELAILVLLASLKVVPVPLVRVQVQRTLAIQQG